MTNVEKTFLPWFDAICDLLLGRRTVTWNLSHNLVDDFKAYVMFTPNDMNLLSTDPVLSFAKAVAITATDACCNIYIQFH